MIGHHFIEIVTERNNFIMTDCIAKMSSSIKICTKIVYNY